MLRTFVNMLRKFVNMLRKFVNMLRKFKFHKNLMIRILYTKTGAWGGVVVKALRY